MSRSGPVPGCLVSVVCPAFDEEEVLPRFHAELCGVLRQLPAEYAVEVVYADDGSRDSTLHVLRSLASVDDRVRYVSLSRNFGVQVALTAGLEHARGDVVISMDSDLQHPPELIPVLLAKWREGYDVILTLRQENRYMGPVKRFTTRAFYRLMHWLADIDVRAEASDFRLLSRRAVDALLRMRETHRFLRGMVSWLGFRTATIVFKVSNRGGGVSKHDLRRLTNLAIDGMLSFSKLPLRLPLLLGSLFTGGGLAYGTVATMACLIQGGSPLWPAHLAVVTFLVVGGCILAALGVVGEYVGRVYEQVKARPLYLVKESVPAVAATTKPISVPVPPNASSEEPNCPWPAEEVSAA